MDRAASATTVVSPAIMSLIAKMQINTNAGYGNAPRGTGGFECSVQRQFKKDCPNLKNKNGTSGVSNRSNA